MLKTIAFLFLVVASVICYIPFLLTKLDVFRLQLGSYRYAGIPVIIGGLLFLVPAILSFAMKGKGTPAVFFARYFSYLIGNEPARLITENVYRFTRNPMYLGVLLITAGEGIIFDHPVLLLYTCLLFIFFHVVIVFLEEPHLKKKYGIPYEEFLLKSKRWI